MKPARFEYVRPSTLAQAVGALAGAADARVMAGNQSLGPMLNLRIARPTLVVDISRLSELRRVETDDTGITIGACVTHSAIEDGEAPDAANGLMRRVAGGIAYRAVRNRGTIGGSLAHADPAADWPPVLMALDAEVNIRGPKGGRSLPVGRSRPVSSRPRWRPARSSKRSASRDWIERPASGTRRSPASPAISPRASP
jgi:carbon-monoxide dehydrogenase medium subunit